jgi:phosphodiesterase/alkaline phosphatase D-like protein
MLLILIMMGIPDVPFFSATSLGSAVPDQITLTVNGDPQTTQTITWRMDYDADNGQVQYVEHNATKSFPYDVRTVTATVQKISANTGNSSRHSVTLTRLKPKTLYHYRVGYGNVWSEWLTFTTSCCS